MSDGQIVFEISADGRKAYASIEDITKELKKNGAQWEKDAKASTDSIGNAFEGMLKKVAGAFSAAKIGQMLLSIGKDAIEAASSLSEVQNVVDVTFGEAGAQKIENWAKRAGDQFGLTETQAKKFTSTLGAMMKSAGMSGDEIVQISTDLSGLAADMASFYNLDFDTAFQKIRSGISGQTMPLKELGIDMSVATLNAFALQQGLSKTFEQMTQGEQTMLRYQYLMQATADAQGDFARTSDGFANATRKLETNIESLKAKLGTVLLPVINEVIGGLNDMLGKLTQEKKRTVLDDFADIDLKTQEKISQIKATANNARELTDVLDGFDDKFKNIKTSSSKMLDDVPNGKTGKLKDLTGTLEKLEGQADKNKTAISKMDADAPKGENLEPVKKKLVTIEKTAINGKQKVKEITSDPPDEKKLEPVINGVKTIEKTAMNGKKKVKEITSEPPDETKLKPVQEGVKTIEKTAMSGKKAIKEMADEPPKKEKVDPLKDKLTEVKDEADKGQKAIENIAKNAPEGNVLDGLADSVSSVATKANEAASEIAASVMATEEIASQDALWLATCKELVDTIPGLSSIINTQTGEIKGGTDAVRAYIDAWEQGQKGLALMSAHEQKRGALESHFAELPELELDKTVGEYRVKKARAQLDAMLKEYGLNMTADEIGTFAPNSAYATETLGISGERAEQLSKEVAYYKTLQNNSEEATRAYNEQKAAYDEAVIAYETEGKALEETYGKAIKTLDDWTDAQKQAGTEAINTFNEALKAVTDYYEEVRKATADQVKGELSGFKEVKTAAEQYKEAANSAKTFREELEKARKEGKNNLTDYEIDIKVNDKNAQVTLEGLTRSLQSQLDYIKEYETNLQRARELGLDEHILAQLSDGSNESALQLHAITEAFANWDESKGIPKDIENLNKLYADVNSHKETFTDTLTQQKLAVDENYDAMVKKAEEAAKALDVSGTASQSTANNITAMAQAIGDHIPEVRTQVDAVLAELNRLNSWGVNIDYGFGGSTVIKPFSSSSAGAAAGAAVGKAVQGSFATGLDWVPFDGFLASLHAGESILTAEEARIWRRFRDGGRGVDYDQLGGVMRDNIKPGGDVYLDGRVVGSVISQMQGAQYRALQRSGWQQ